MDWSRVSAGFIRSISIHYLDTTCTLVTNEDTTLQSPVRGRNAASSCNHAPLHKHKVLEVWCHRKRHLDESRCPAFIWKAAHCSQQVGKGGRNVSNQSISPGSSTTYWCLSAAGVLRADIEKKGKKKGKKKGWGLSLPPAAYSAPSPPFLRLNFPPDFRALWTSGCCCFKEAS